MYKKILSIDTSCNHISIAILYNHHFDEEIAICNNNHEKKILKILHIILKRNKIRIKNFEIIAFSNGPGNFTSIRLAAGITQGLSIPYNTPIIGISTLKVLAEQAWRIKKIKKVIVCFATNNNNFYYWAKYKKNSMNMWVGKNTESMIHINKIYQKINYLTELWYIIGLNMDIFKKIKNNFLKFIDITIPYARDLISLTLMSKNIKNHKLQKIHVNYLNTPKYRKSIN
ncbi:tRNA (adenosine(37)-N6)-threonylcarbamoyltransferase complex dimerization subunit type 1 TsaB [Buchnera aphidicola]|uniref:tRNA (adenosine(37)-N6)-threonylcarbamoyltransferase complex dimerization subunit type 1 TsaB n=1 Tax=Buchnera aphidicola TaxID=9 RepID=UPI0034641E96